MWPSRYFHCNPFPIHDFWTWECTQVVADHNETQNEIIQAASITDHRGLVQRSSGTTRRSEYGLKVFKSMHRRPDQSHHCWTQSLPPHMVQVDSERTHVTITSLNNERCGRTNSYRISFLIDYALFCWDPPWDYVRECSWRGWWQLIRFFPPFVLGFCSISVLVFFSPSFPFLRDLLSFYRVPLSSLGDFPRNSTQAAVGFRFNCAYHCVGIGTMY